MNHPGILGSLTSSDIPSQTTNDMFHQSLQMTRNFLKLFFFVLDEIHHDIRQTVVCFLFSKLKRFLKMSSTASLETRDGGFWDLASF